MAAVMLEEIEMGGQASQFAGNKNTFFLALRGTATEDAEKLQEGDVFAVTEGVDVEAGDLVVWWTGVARTLALARVAPDMSFQGVGGFPAPVEGQAAKVRGVVVGRLRQFAPGAEGEADTEA
ncbi:MAG: hypothetical protein ACPG31_11625 [Planctomycetota bacterium]